MSIVVPPTGSDGVSIVSSVQRLTERPTVSHPGVKQGVIRIVSFAAAPGMQETNMHVFTDVRLTDDLDGTVYTGVFPTPP